jgi:cytochrome d ubiquinol oxidase subunit I
MRAWIFAAPLGYIAVETGWIVRCVGRQPWIVYGQLRTVESVSPLPAGEVLFSLVGLTALYTVFFVAALYFGSRIIREGPNLELPAPVPANAAGDRGRACPPRARSPSCRSSVAAVW